MGITDQIEIRFAQQDDLNWCVDLDRQVGEEIIKHKIEVSEIIVVELKGKLIGYLRLEYMWSKVPYMSLILLQKEHQGHGIGRAVLEYLETYLREKGYTVVLSSSQVDEPAPQAWHRAVGFEECGVIAGVNEKGVGEIFFRKSLK